MAKKAANGSGKAKTAKKTKKPSAEQISDEQRQRLLLSHRRRLKPLLLTEAAAKAAVNKAYELAKKEGVTKKEIQIAISIESDDGTERWGAEIERIMRVARWMGSKIGAQLDLDLFPKSLAEQAFEDGKRAALDDQPRKPPDHLSQQSAQRWMDGHDQGRTALNESRAKEFGPLADAASKVVREIPGAHATTIGAEPPTFHPSA